MIQATVLAPLALAVVLVVSAVAKLRDPGSLDEAFTHLRVPPALGRPWLRRIVPWGELALAVGLLVPAPVSVLAAVGSLVLFGVYTWLIVRAWRAPQEASCHCFGALTTGRVSGWTVVRNGVLVAASLVAIADAVGAAPVAARLLEGGVLAWVLGAAVVGLLVFTIIHEPDAAPAEPPPAASLPVDVDDEEYTRLPIPFTQLTTPAGDRRTLRELVREGAQLLVNVSFSCGSCGEVMAAMEGWQRQMPEVQLRPVVRNGVTEFERFGALADRALVDTENAMGVLEMNATPSAVLLGADGLIAGGPVSGTQAIADLVEGMIEQLVEARGEVAQA